MDGVESEETWAVVLWGDPINEAQYMSLVLQRALGHARDEAHRLVLEAHGQDGAVVSTGDRETAENAVARLHAYGLSATLERSSIRSMP